MVRLTVLRIYTNISTVPRLTESGRTGDSAEIIHRIIIPYEVITFVAVLKPFTVKLLNVSLIFLLKPTSWTKWVSWLLYTSRSISDSDYSINEIKKQRCPNKNTRMCCIVLCCHFIRGKVKRITITITLPIRIFYLYVRGKGKNYKFMGTPQ